ncbi:MAG: XRE family transcriptional regulator [Rhodobacteraceae bacterium]|nr:MAG: XRE family transcriptional regulator [Paracoccaceae bacterium]
MKDLRDPHERLRQARINAGFATVADAAKAFGWKYPTYAGHENGHRGMKTHDVKKYADAFKVTEVWLLTGKSESDSPKPQPKGFSESLGEYHAPTDSLRLVLERLLGQLAPTARSTTTLFVPRDYPTLALMRGDIVFVDLSTIDPPPGTIVVSRIVDSQGIDATTFRLSSTGGPLPPYGEPALEPDQDEGIVGTVIGSIRGAPAGAFRSDH